MNVYFVSLAFGAILSAGTIYAIYRVEPPSVKRKRAYQEKELARKTLQKQKEGTEKENN